MLLNDEMAKSPRRARTAQVDPDSGRGMHTGQTNEFPIFLDYFRHHYLEAKPTVSAAVTMINAAGRLAPDPFYRESRGCTVVHLLKKISCWLSTRVNKEMAFRTKDLLNFARDLMKRTFYFRLNLI
ncbi:MAG: hypothetical protein WBG50_01070 [Desulfomonilaceae bacterium]